MSMLPSNIHRLLIYRLNPFEWREVFMRGCQETVNAISRIQPVSGVTGSSLKYTGHGPCPVLTGAGSPGWLQPHLVFLSAWRQWGCRARRVSSYPCRGLIHRKQPPELLAGARPLTEASHEPATGRANPPPRAGLRARGGGGLRQDRSRSGGVRRGLWAPGGEQTPPPPASPLTARPWGDGDGGGGSAVERRGRGGRHAATLTASNRRRQPRAAGPRDGERASGRSGRAGERRWDPPRLSRGLASRDASLRRRRRRSPPSPPRPSLTCGGARAQRPLTAAVNGRR